MGYSPWGSRRVGHDWSYWVCVCVCVCGASDKWNHAIFVLLCLSYAFKHNSFKVYLQCSNYQIFSPFLRLNNILLYILTTFCSSLHPQMDPCIASTFWILWITLVWYECTSIWDPAFNSLIYTPLNGVAVLLVLFSSIRNIEGNHHLRCYSSIHESGVGRKNPSLWCKFETHQNMDDIDFGWE